MRGGGRRRRAAVQGSRLSIRCSSDTRGGSKLKFIRSSKGWARTASSPPSSGVMKPKPLSEKNLTLPTTNEWERSGRVSQGQVGGIRWTRGGPVGNQRAGVGSGDSRGVGSGLGCRASAALSAAAFGSGLVWRVRAELLLKPWAPGASLLTSDAVSLALDRIVHYDAPARDGAQ